MFFILSKILGALLQPFSWVVLLLLFSLWAKGTLRKRLIITALVFIFFFGNKAINHIVVRWWEPAPPPSVVLERPYDVGIVLGGFSNLKVYHQDDFYDFGCRGSRLTQAVELYFTGKIYRILISGGSGFVSDQTASEGRAIKDYLIRVGVPEEHILIEPDSRNTYENAVYTKALLEKESLDQTRLLLITSANHLYRSKRIFKKVGLAVTPFPVDFVGEEYISTPDFWLIPTHITFENWSSLIHEWVGLLVYKMRGWI